MRIRTTLNVEMEYSLWQILGFLTAILRVKTDFGNDSFNMIHNDE